MALLLFIRSSLPFCPCILKKHGGSCNEPNLSAASDAASQTMKTRIIRRKAGIFLFCQAKECGDSEKLDLKLPISVTHSPWNYERMRKYLEAMNQIRYFTVKQLLKCKRRLKLK